MPNTFIKISTVTVGAGGASTINFSSIPSTYTDLALLVSGRGTASEGSGGHYYSINLNNSSSNFTQRFLQIAVGPAVSSGTSSGSTGNYMPPSDYTSNTFSNNLTYFPNYTSSSNKSFSTDSLAENNSTSNYYVLLNSLLWSQTTAINQITLIANSGNFAQYSTATLYGISKS
jgi:hypothetical protein